MLISVADVKFWKRSHRSLQFILISLTASTLKYENLSSCFKAHLQRKINTIKDKQISYNSRKRLDRFNSLTAQP
jgi:hypothetical protein